MERMVFQYLIFKMHFSAINSTYCWQNKYSIQALVIFFYPLRPFSSETCLFQAHPHWGQRSPIGLEDSIFRPLCWAAVGAASRRISVVFLGWRVIKRPFVI